LEAQPALVEYFVSLMRVRSSIAAEYNLLTRRLERGALFKDVGCAYSMHRLLWTDTRGDAVLIYEAGPQPEQFGRVALPGSPYGIAIDLLRDQLWVTLTAEQRVVQFALEGRTLRCRRRWPSCR
jgi:hypothetical protein